MTTLTSIAVIGGTGAEGGALALRLANAGHRVCIGSRDAARAQAAADAINTRLGATRASGAASRAAAASCPIVLLAVPYAGQQATALDLKAELEGKILIDATVPLVPPQVSRVQLPEGGSAVAKLQALLGPGVKVVAAFQNVSAHLLDDLAHTVDCDVLVCGDDAAACETVLSLVASIGLRGVHAGPVANAAAAEALTSLLIAINRRHKVKGSGIRITGIG